MAEIGRQFVEYVLESEHQSWDGWDREKIPVVYELLQDMVYSFQYAREHPPQSLGVMYGFDLIWNDDGSYREEDRT